jgi:TetR/AcrR family transcriptional repressor of nem operon
VNLAVSLPQYQFASHRYLDIISGVLADAKWNRGCLIGDFSLETSQSKRLRERLDAIFQEWCAPFAACIADAQTAGEIDSTFDPMDLAEFLLASGRAQFSV